MTDLAAPSTRTAANADGRPAQRRADRPGGGGATARYGFVAAGDGVTRWFLGRSWLDHLTRPGLAPCDATVGGKVGSGTVARWEDDDEVVVDGFVSRAVSTVVAWFGANDVVPRNLWTSTALQPPRHLGERPPE